MAGPLFFELPGEETEVPSGDGPLVLVAPSTSQDPDQRLVRVALEGLADEPVRVLATTNRKSTKKPIDVPANAKLVDWVLYSQVMPLADVVICHGGHGTVVRSLSYGTPVLVSPAGGDMGENAARVAWSGAGLSLPRRLLSPRGIRMATRRLLGERSFSERAEEIARWSRDHDGASAAAELVEEATEKAKSRLAPAPSKS